MQLFVVCATVSQLYYQIKNKFCFNIIYNGIKKVSGTSYYIYLEHVLSPQYLKCTLYILFSLEVFVFLMNMEIKPFSL